MTYNVFGVTLNLAQSIKLETRLATFSVKCRMHFERLLQSCIMHVSRLRKGVKVR